jgi:hypothetical protein
MFSIKVFDDLFYAAIWSKTCPPFRWEERCFLTQEVMNTRRHLKCQGRTMIFIAYIILDIMRNGNLSGLIVNHRPARLA